LYTYRLNLIAAQRRGTELGDLDRLAIVGGDFSTVLYILRSGKFRPFLETAVGGFIQSPRFRPESGLSMGSKSAVSWGAGVGVDVVAGRRSVGVDLRLVGLSDQSYSNDPWLAARVVVHR